jgi:aerotaxis receptor
MKTGSPRPGTKRGGFLQQRQDRDLARSATVRARGPGCAHLPITTTERLLEDGKSIVSKTDLQGNITYVNPYFMEISGFDEAELIGAPQNIVRHPDMPREAFADMWATLKEGLPWNGLVKNRCKNGDYYWVQANVTPVRENGRAVGYMSVRTRPSREQVQAADSAYRTFVAGQARPAHPSRRSGADRLDGLAARPARSPGGQAAGVDDECTHAHVHPRGCGGRQCRAIGRGSPGAVWLGTSQVPPCCWDRAVLHASIVAPAAACHQVRPAWPAAT